MADRVFAVIDPASPRAAAWRALLHADHAPVVSPEPGEDEVDGVMALCHEVDLPALSPEQFGRFIAFYAGYTGLPTETVAVGLVTGEYGISIVAEDVRICPDPAEGRAWFAARAKS